MSAVLKSFVLAICVGWFQLCYRVPKKDPVSFWDEQLQRSFKPQMKLSKAEDIAGT